MASTAGRLAFRGLVLLAICVVAFYVGRPLYWKLSATLHEKTYDSVAVKEGFSQFMQSAQRTVGGWIRDDADSEVIEQPVDEKSKNKKSVETAKS